VLASGILVVLGLLLLVVGVTGNWHWRAAIWGAVLASVAAFGLVAYAANQRRSEFPAEVDEDQSAEVPPPPTPPELVKASAEADPAPPRPRFAGFGKTKTKDAPPPAPPEVKPPPPQPTNVQVMHVQGSNVRAAPPATPPTIQVGVPREPGFPTYQPVDPGAPVIQVRNRYHRPDCRYVAVAAAEDAVQTTVGEARATNAMPCGVCRP
jgi:hypothetical protein